MNRFDINSAVRKSLTASVILLLAVPAVRSANITKAGSGTDVTAGASWTGSVAPTSSDVATWDTGSLGAGLSLNSGTPSWLGIKVNAGAPSAINIGSGGTLTNGMSGIDMSAATINTTIGCNLALGSGYQSWLVASGKTLAINGAVTRATGASVNFPTTGVTSTTLANNNGILGGWATIGNAGTSGASGDWAAIDGSGNIITYSGYTSITGSQGAADYSTQNWKVNNAAGALTASATVNSLVLTTDFSISSGATMTLGSGGLILSGASRWLKNNGNGNTTGTAQITSGLSSGELFIDSSGSPSANGDWRIWPKIIDNGSTPVILVKNGLGYLRLENANTYSGGTIINGGLVFLSNNSAAGGNSALGTGTVTLNGGTLNLDTATLANNFVVPANASATIDNAANNATLNGNFSGAGTLTLQNSVGPGLSENVGGSWNGFTGTLNYNGSASANNFNIFAPASMNLSGAIVNFSNSGNRTGSSFRTSGTTKFGSLAGFGYLDVAGTVEIGNLNTSTTFSGVVRDNGSAGTFTKVGNGALTLSGASTYTGGTIVNAGVLNLGLGGGAGTIRGTLTINPGATVNTTVSDALGYTSGQCVSTANVYGGTLNNSASGNNGYITTFNLMGGTITSSGGGAFNVSGTGTTINSLATNITSTVSGPVVLRDGTVTINTAAGTVPSGIDLTMSGVISGSVGLTKAGNGTLKFSAANTYSGTTTVNAGKLLVNNSTGSGTGSGAVSVNNANTTLGGTGTLSGAITLNAGTILSPGESSTTGATLTCNGGITFSSAKPVFDLSASAASGNDQVVVSGAVTIGSADTITINPIATATLDTADYTLFTATSVGGSGTPTLSWGNSTPANAADYSLVKNATSLVLHYTAPGSPPVIGAVQFSPGSTVNVGNTVTASATVNSSGTGLTYQWQNSPDGSTWSNIGGATSATYSVPTGSTGTTYYRLTATDSFGTGTGTGAALTVRTPTSLTWLASPANNFWNHTAINWSGGGGIFADGDSVTFNSTGSGGTVTLTETAVPASVTFSNDNNYTLANSGGSVSGTTSLSKSVTGTLTLSGANTFSGGTTLNAGTLAVGNNAALGTGTITLAGGTLVNTGSDITLTNTIQASASTTTVLDNGTANNFTINGNITGSGTLTRGSSFTATVYLGGDNSGFTGTYQDQNNGNSITRWTSPNAGSANARWIFNQAQVDTRTTPNFGTGTIHFGSISGGGFISQNSPGTATLQVGALGLNDTFSGSMRNGAGTIALTKVGAGTLTFSGANTYTGATTVSNGTLLVNSPGALGNTAVAVKGGATLGGSGTIVGAVTVEAGGTLAPGASGIGALTNGSLTLNSGATAAMEIGDGPTGDKSVATGAVVYGGTLKLIWAGTTPTAGTVQLFSGSAYSGSFSSLQLSNWPSAYRVTTNNLTTDGSITIAANVSPVAQNLTAGVVQGGTTTLQIIGGKHSATDADGDSISVTAVGTPTSGSASFTSGSVSYTASGSTGTNTFTYTVTDSFGASDTKTVTVVVTDPQGFNQVWAGVSGGNAVLTYLGIPGTNYALEITHTLPATNWAPVITNPASANGYLYFTNPISLSPTNDYYRTRYVP